MCTYFNALDVRAMEEDENTAGYGFFIMHILISRWNMSKYQG